MPPAPHLVTAPERHLRISRTIEPLKHSFVGAIEASQARNGNRFDVPGGGVLYTATHESTCFDEVLARMRPSPWLQTLDWAEDERAGFPIGLPADWRDQRRIYTVRVSTDLPFVDIDHPDTWRWMENAAPGVLLEAHNDHVDREHVYSSNRRLTRAMSTAIYTSLDAENLPLFAGIRYESRLGQGECWAIFDGRPNTTLEQISAERIERSRPTLQTWAEQWKLTIH